MIPSQQAFDNGPGKKYRVVQQRIIDKLVDKFLQAVEYGHSELLVKIDDGCVNFAVTEKNRDNLY